MPISTIFFLDKRCCLGLQLVCPAGSMLCSGNLKLLGRGCSISLLQHRGDKSLLLLCPLPSHCRDAVRGCLGPCSQRCWLGISSACSFLQDENQVHITTPAHNRVFTFFPFPKHTGTPGLTQLGFTSLPRKAFIQMCCILGQNAAHGELPSTAVPPGLDSPRYRHLLPHC